MSDGSALATAFRALARFDQTRAVDLLIQHIDPTGLARALEQLAESLPAKPTRRNPGRRPPTIGSAPLPPELVARIRALAPTIAAAAAMLGLRRPELSDFLRGRPVPPSFRARIDAALVTLDQDAEPMPEPAHSPMEPAHVADEQDLFDLVRARAQAHGIELRAETLIEAGAPSAVQTLLSGSAVGQHAADLIFAWAIQD
jgi:hypothetical protein